MIKWKSVMKETRVQLVATISLTDKVGVCILGKSYNFEATPL